MVYKSGKLKMYPRTINRAKLPIKYHEEYRKRKVWLVRDEAVRDDTPEQRGTDDDSGRRSGDSKDDTGVRTADTDSDGDTGAEQADSDRERMEWEGPA